MRAWLRIIGLLLITVGIIPSKGMAETIAAPAQSSSVATNMDFKALDGSPMPLSSFAGKTLLIVNTASNCGFTPQYAGLQKLYDTYKDRGLVVIGVPSNDFGNQEPGDAAAIKTFTETSFHVTFPLTQKEVVSGENAHPFFKKVRSDLGVFATPKWNFYKYVVSPEGKLIGWWSSKTSPNDADIIKAIEDNLPKTPPAK